MNNCGYTGNMYGANYNGGYGAVVPTSSCGNGNTFIVIVVLFILLIIIGAITFF